MINNDVWELVHLLIEQGKARVEFTCSKTQQTQYGFGATRLLDINVKSIGEDSYEIRCMEGPVVYPSDKLSRRSLFAMFCKYPSYKILKLEQEQFKPDATIELKQSEISPITSDYNDMLKEKYEIIEVDESKQEVVIGEIGDEGVSAEQGEALAEHSEVKADSIEALAPENELFIADEVNVSGMNITTEQGLLEDFGTEVKVESKPNIEEEQAQSSLPSTQDQLTERIKELLLKNSKQEVERVKHGKGCKKCGYTGWITDEETGMTVQCDCQSVTELKKQVQAKAPQVKIKNTRALEAVVPIDYRDRDFDLEKAKTYAGSIAMNLELRIMGYGSYIDTVKTVLTSINTSELKNSYIIGAPNGFGKATFVYTAIKRLIAQGKPVVPYLSLIELAELRVEYEDRLLSKLKNPRFSKSLRLDPDEYIWKDFIGAPVLFTYFSSVDSKVIESAALNALMNLRSAKGRPTIVTTAFSLDPYVGDQKLRSYYWNDMISITNKESSTGVDRLIHRSCYLRPMNSMNVVKGVDY